MGVFRVEAVVGAAFRRFESSSPSRKARKGKTIVGFSLTFLLGVCRRVPNSVIRTAPRVAVASGRLSIRGINVSEFEANTGSPNVFPALENVLTEGEPSSGAAEPIRGEREGLPRSYRMRADTHYVDQLAARSAGQPVRMVSIDQIDSTDSFRQVEIEPLIQSIRAHGVVNPLLIRRHAAGYSVIAGRKRLAAAQILRLPTVPCVLHEVDDTQAALLARADNLILARVSQPDAQLGMVAAVRQAVGHHLAAVQAGADLASSGAQPMGRAAVDLIKAHAWRAARLLDALDAIANAPERSSRVRSVSSIVEQVIEGFGAESRLNGVTIRAHLADGVSWMMLQEHEALVGLSSAVLATLPLLEHVEQPTIAIRVAATHPDLVTLAVAQTAVPVPLALARRFFDEMSNDRAGGWCAVASALAVKVVAERHGGTATFDVRPNGDASFKMQLLPS